MNGPAGCDEDHAAVAEEDDGEPPVRWGAVQVAPSVASPWRAAGGRWASAGGGSAYGCPTAAGSRGAT